MRARRSAVSTSKLQLRDPPGRIERRERDRCEVDGFCDESHVGHHRADGAAQRRAAPAQARSTREGNQRARVNGVLRQLDLLVRARPRCAVVLWRPFGGCLP